jgi:hypothetical protein
MAIAGTRIWSIQPFAPHTYVCVCVCVCVCECMYVSVIRYTVTRYVCMYVCVFVLYVILCMCVIPRSSGIYP